MEDIAQIILFRLLLQTIIMSDETATAPATPAAATPKKKAKTAAKKPKTAPTHPKVADMVTEAITSLKERGGSSLQAIKKHIGSKHKVDLDRLTPFIKKYLKSAVASGALIQTKGKGASGSFKLSASGQKTKEPGKAKKAKKEGASPAKKPKSAAKKTAKPKAKAAEKKKPAAKKPAAKKAAKPKSPKKAKPSKPKAPKVKKMKTPKKATPKKGKK